MWYAGLLLTTALVWAIELLDQFTVIHPRSD
jgi:hypothetical protein